MIASSIEGKCTDRSSVAGSLAAATISSASAAAVEEEAKITAAGPGGSGGKALVTEAFATSVKASVADAVARHSVGQTYRCQLLRQHSMLSLCS